MWVINELDCELPLRNVLFSSRARFNFTGLGGPFLKIVQHQSGLQQVAAKTSITAGVPPSLNLLPWTGFSSLKISCTSNASSKKQRRIMISTT
ncbi:hypothetical protein MKW92_001182 [Papaver armeniacum]|nr:hypothetical protein MKW92_001182 [Papaver armeniacum]